MSAATPPTHKSRGEQVRAQLEQRRHRGADQRLAIAAQHLALETIKTVQVPSKLFFERGAGPYLFDSDGRRYIDMLMGFGVHLLGHRPPHVEKAVTAQLAKGWHFGLSNVLQAEFAQKVAQLSEGQDKVLFCGSGSEATYYACRVARAFAQRDFIAVFDGSYHGSHDYALIKADPASPRRAPQSMRLGRGIPQAVERDTMLVLPFNDPAAFELIRQRGGNIAAVLVQPVQNNAPRLDMAPFLQGLRSVCDATGALLIFDEVVTGLRLSLRGAQGYFDIRPDLTAYGKAFGGGLPIGALAGRAEFMDLFPKPNEQGGVFSSGTFNANPLTMAAGLATVEYLERQGTPLYARLEMRANRLAAEINAFAQREKLPVQLMNAASMMMLIFQREALWSSRDARPAPKQALEDFFLHMLARDVLMPANRMVLLSTEHQDADVAAVAAAIKESLYALREDRLI